MQNRANRYQRLILQIILLSALLLVSLLMPQRSYAADHSDDDRDGIPNSVECIGKATELPLSVINGSFELPEIRRTLSLTSRQWGSYPKIAGSYKSFLVDGWSTTATDNEIELWRSGYDGVQSHTGKQFAEINANQSAALYQEIATSPGSTMRWSFAHRGRTGVDTIELLVGPPDGPYNSLGTFSTGKDSWSVYEGTYLVPGGQTETRFFYKAIATANGNTTTGNFLDDIQFFQLGSCDRDTDGDGIINSDDLDSDNDGILDIIEAGLTDADHDGQVDDESQLGSAGGVPDHDSDDLPDFLDLDADGDGIPDNVEGRNTEDFTPPSDTVDSKGVDHAFGGGITPVDTDGDGDADYLDLDSDEDGWSDTTESHSELHNLDNDLDGLDGAIDVNDEVWGPPSAGITDTLTLYPNNGTESDWRNLEVENDGSGVGSGVDGGLESEPLPIAPSSFLGAVGNSDDNNELSAAAFQDFDLIWHKANRRQAYVLGLDELMPAAGPLNTTPQPAVPADVLAVTTAPDAKAVDFVDPAGNVQAVALGILSVGEPYAHDYGVCNRFKGYRFDQVAPLLIDVPPANRAWFWHSTAKSEEYGYEDALLFHIFVNETERTFHIDSSWTQDGYDNTIDFAYEYVFNMQVWSNNPAVSTQLLQAILLRLNSFGEGDWQVVYHNDEKPTAPTVLIQHVTTSLDTVTLDLTADTPATEVTIHGTWRSQSDRTTLQQFAQTVSLPAATTTLPLTFPGLLDATIYVESNGFTDKIYAGSGLWFVAGSDQTNADKLTLGDCRSTEDIDKQDLLLAGCAALDPIRAASADAVGIGRTLNPNGMPVDVSPYQALRFWAKGNGVPVRILLESESIEDDDYYQTVFVPTAEWQQYIIPLRDFRQRGFGTPTLYTGTDIKAVLWLNAENNGQDLALALDQVSFTNNGLLAPTALAENNSDTGPRTVRFSTIETGTIADTTLYYSLDNGRTYQSVTMHTTRSAGGLTTVEGQLPGQPLGTDVRYYVEVTHGNGYRSRMPVDAPATYYRYQVDDRLSLLVDDFGAGRPYNRVGGVSGLFNEPTHGGTLFAYQSEEQLILDYQVDQSNQYAGYYTELQGSDLQSYQTIDLLVRGEKGGEQLHIGLRDGNGYEPRLSVGDFLPGGLQTQWQWIQIPLASFGKTLDRTAIESMSFTFYNQSVPTRGRLYIAEIRFTTLATAQVIDTFDDGDLQQNGQGLGYWTSAPAGTLTVSAAPGDATKAGGYALQLDYTVGTDGYALWHSELNELSAPTDGQLTFWVRGASAGTDAATVPVSIYLTDAVNRARVALADYTALSSEWRLVTIPLSAFAGQGVDINVLTGFEVAFEFGTGSSTLWVDNIYIGPPGSPQVNRRVVHLYAEDLQYLALHQSAGTAWRVSTDVPWLLLSPNGAGAATLRVQSAPWGLESGTYQGTITLSSVTEVGAAQAETITVHLVVLQPLSVPNRIFLPVVTR